MFRILVFKGTLIIEELFVSGVIVIFDQLLQVFSELVKWLFLPSHILLPLLLVLSFYKTRSLYLMRILLLLLFQRWSFIEGSVVGVINRLFLFVGDVMVSTIYHFNDETIFPFRCDYLWDLLPPHSWIIVNDTLVIPTHWLLNVRISRILLRFKYWSLEFGWHRLIIRDMCILSRFHWVLFVLQSVR